MLLHLLPTIFALFTSVERAAGQCFGSDDLNTEFAQIITGDDAATTIPIDGSCCQKEVCGLPCADEPEPPATVRDLRAFLHSYQTCHLQF